MKLGRKDGTKNERNLIQICLLGTAVLLLPSLVQAQFTYTNIDGGIYDYDTNADGVSLTINGYVGPPWTVTIPTNIDGLMVIRIGEFAFAEMDEGPWNLTGITIPASVTSIGAGAFYSCASLTGVTLPSSITNFGNNVFDSCYSVTNVTIANGITSTGEGTFANCFSLTSVTLPQSVTNIGFGSFYNCIDLTNFTILGCVTSIGTEAFDSCAFTNFTIPASVTSIGDSAFDNCDNLISITIPVNVTNIGIETFELCDTLTSVYFKGNAPNFVASPFWGDSKATLYYLPGAIGWRNFSTEIGDPPVTAITPVLWTPQVQESGISLGVRSDQFGFNIIGTNNFTVVVETCTSLAGHVWTPLQTNTLANGSYYFSDPQWTNYGSRFYQLSMP
ncbi:MAG TPA: leucine-rich repeat domain-containing protein [Candidatus Saccharimonadales bacterium]|nr:leucine-rich repeat domain-containing protein [Candidatus Saccharimonadales bacterium]